MKSYLLMGAATFCVWSAALAQDKVQVPAAVKQAFTQAYPDVTKVKWTRDNGNYEAEFVDKNKDTKAEYTASGDLVEIETYVAVTTLPQPAFDYMKDNYRNKYIKKDATKITKANGDVYYQANVKRTDLVFDANGRFVKVTP